MLGKLWQARSQLGLRVSDGWAARKEKRQRTGGEEALPDCEHYKD